MYRIAIVTATRAEYGLLVPLIRQIIDDDNLELDFIVTGGHLSEKQGMTINEILNDGFPISHKIFILDEDNSAYGISITMANAIKGFAECFRDDRPDMVVILGDRTEMLGVASAAWISSWAAMKPSLQPLSIVSRSSRSSLMRKATALTPMTSATPASVSIARA